MLPIPPMSKPEPEVKPAPKTVFVVSGFTGEYEDKHDWKVAAFFDEAKAKARAAKLNEFCVEQKVHFDQPRAERADGWDLECPLDPKFHVGSTGTCYFVWSISIEDT